jgi:hypothetical protein
MSKSLQREQFLLDMYLLLIGSGGESVNGVTSNLSDARSTRCNGIKPTDDTLEYSWVGIFSSKISFRL